MHLRKGLSKASSTLGNVAILPVSFSAKFNPVEYEKYMATPTSYVFSQELLPFANGDEPAMFRKDMSTVEIIYVPFNVDNKHWVALKIELSSWSVTVVDSIINFIHHVQPLLQMLPSLLSLYKHTHYLRHEVQMTQKFILSRM